MDIQTIETLASRVEAAAADIDTRACMPEDLQQELAQNQLFTLLLPSWLGGREMPFPDYVRCVERFGRADGSVGWCVNQGSVLASLAHRFAPEAARGIWTSPSVAVANGPPAGPCRATPAESGYRLSGHWTFSSGIRAATYLIGAASQDEGPALWCFFDKADADIDATWDVDGLRGTASYAFAVNDLFIPADRAIEMKPVDPGAPLYHIPLNLLFACGFAAVALGVSRGALDFAIERTRTKVKRFQKQSMSLDPVTQRELGRAEADWQAARALLYSAVDEVWAGLESTFGQHEKMRLRLAGTHTIRSCKAVTDRVYDLCSTDSIFRSNEIQRRFRDIHVITQHLQARPENYQLIGSHLLALPFNETMIS